MCIYIYTYIERDIHHITYTLYIYIYTYVYIQSEAREEAEAAWQVIEDVATALDGRLCQSILLTVDDIIIYS